MCIGMPMQVFECDNGFAWCEADGQRERLDMALIGTQPAGTWVLAFHGTARQVMGAEEAGHARAARQALAAVQAGDGYIDSFFADLIARTPQLPEHLRPATEPSAIPNKTAP